MKISESTSSKSRKAFVEDADDADTGKAITIVDPPPAAPGPLSAIAQPINVFDFLVTGDTPNASTTSLAPAVGMKMVNNAPSIFGDHRASSEKVADHDSLYEKHGYSYGSEPVPTIKERREIECFTPAPKHLQNESQTSVYGLENPSRKSTDKKRKRLHVEELDLTEAHRLSQEPETVMAEAPNAPILHSGLTGGLGRLLSKSRFPPSPDYSNGDPSPPSPVKRPKQILAKEKDRGRKKVSRTGGGQLVRIRKRRTSDESRPRKQHRSHHSPDHHGHPKRKAIEYHPQSRGDDSQQLIVYKSRAELFMSFVNKGPESEHGYSVHKALKRYHRERGEQGLGLEKADEEKELFKGLRLKKNERGEVVVFF